MSFSSSYHATPRLCSGSVFIPILLYWFLANVKFVHLFLAGAAEGVMMGLITPWDANIINHPDIVV